MYPIPRTILCIAISSIAHVWIITIADKLWVHDPIALHNEHSNRISLSIKFFNGEKDEAFDLHIQPTTKPIGNSSGLDYTAATPSRVSSHMVYLPAAELDERPVAVQFFDISDESMPPQTRGKLVVSLWINEAGTVDILEIEENNLPDDLTRQMSEQWRSLRFIPGTKHGVPVKSILSYELALN